MSMQVDYAKLISAIIKHQEPVIGNVAWSEAKKVNGLDIRDHTVSIQGDGKVALENLVTQYETMFGKASTEVCREAVRRFIGQLDKNALPEVLR